MDRWDAGRDGSGLGDLWRGVWCWGVGNLWRVLRVIGPNGVGVGDLATWGVANR